MSSNTIFICLDDVGRELVDATPTPNLDTFHGKAQEFTLWTTPACSSTRACFFTQTYGFRNQIGTIIRHSDDHALDYWRVRLPQGPSAMIGKWHLAGGDLTAHPMQVGLDKFDGHMHNLGAGGDGNYFDWERVRLSNDPRDTAPAIHPETEYATSAMTKSAIDAMRKCYHTVFLSYAAVHKPLHVAPYGHEYEEPFDKRKKAQSMLAALDRDLGAVFDAASQLGYRVLLYSDNGSAEDIGGGKGTLYESGIRNLCYAYGWPDLPVRPLVHVVDLMTMADGQLHGDAKRIGSRSLLYSEKFTPNGDPKTSETWDWAMRDARWKVIQTGKDTLLFDLDEDPNEEVNLAEEHPEEVERLIQHIDELHKS